MEKKDIYLSTASWGKSEPTYETKQFLVALIIKEKINNKKLNIIDAGAGLGRNAIYLSKSGFDVTAIEYDEGAIEPLKDNIKENDQSDHIRVINSNIIDYLRRQENHSIDAVLDSGMSHYLTLDEKAEYFMLIKQKMAEDGLFSITHFSEEDKSANGLSEDRLRLLLEGMIELDNIHFDTWTDSISKSKHFAYKGLLAMPDGCCNEIKDIYIRIYHLILDKKITSVEQIHEYLNGQNVKTPILDSQTIGQGVVGEMQQIEGIDTTMIELQMHRQIINEQQKGKQH